MKVRREHMRFYHGSKVPDIEVLKPSISNHGKPWVYLTSRRANTLVYLSNAVEKFHREQKIEHKGKFYTWASYGFNKEGILVIEEYYPQATEETYKGEGGFIYCVDSVQNYSKQEDIPFAFISEQPVAVTSFEYISDVYEEMLRLEQLGEIIIKRYEAHSKEKLEWIEKVIQEDFMQHQDRQDYITFLKGKFKFLNKG